MLGNADVHYNETQDRILSDREVLVLQLLSDGLSVDNIGIRLELSSHTIGIYVSSFINKLNASSVPHAVKIATLEGYIS